jgi:hypothetical protein
MKCQNLHHLGSVEMTNPSRLLLDTKTCKKPQDDARKEILLVLDILQFDLPAKLKIVVGRYHFLSHVQNFLQIQVQEW